MEKKHRVRVMFRVRKLIRVRGLHPFCNLLLP